MDHHAEPPPARSYLSFRSLAFGVWILMFAAGSVNADGDCGNSFTDAPLATQASNKTPDPSEYVAENYDPTTLQFSEAEATAVVEDYVTKNPESRWAKLWNADTTISVRRSVVFGFWIAALVGPVWGAAELTNGFKPMVAAMLVAVVMRVTGVFHYIGSPIESRWGPRFMIWAFKIWGAKKGDAWAHTLATLNGNDMTVADYAGSMLVILNPRFEAAGEALKRGYFGAAADEYVVALSQAFHLFNGANLAHPSITISARHLARRMRGFSETELVLLKEALTESIQKFPEHLLPKNHNRQKFTDACHQMIDEWFK